MLAEIDQAQCWDVCASDTSASGIWQSSSATVVSIFGLSSKKVTPPIFFLERVVISLLHLKNSWAI